MKKKKDTFMVIQIKVCSDAEKDHEKNRRFYAHTFHKTCIICVCRAFFELPKNIQQGIVVHEIGHIVGGPKTKEKEADKIGMKVTGVKIKRIDTEYGASLESTVRFNRTIQNHIHNRIMLIWF